VVAHGVSLASPRLVLDVREEVNHLLGIGARRVRYQPDRPDVSWLREEMGI
jgi:hypothetical protein